jgi:hypothetical protein
MGNLFQRRNLLGEQWRRYLEDQAWLENRRILELIRGIERRALAQACQRLLRESLIINELHGRQGCVCHYAL